jgi:hypothetical protein
MMRFTRNRGSCVVGSRGGAAFLAFEGGGVGLMVVMKVGEDRHATENISPHFLGFTDLTVPRTLASLWEQLLDG